jgi:alpha-glucosidase
MPETGSYLRFERVTSVAETGSGLVAELHRERLRIDLIRTDLVRFKISRGGAFDESPTFAVCVDPESVAFTTEGSGDVVRLRTSALVVSLWLDPFRLDVHRSDGSPIVETAADAAGRYWAYATLNDAFTVRRRCRREDAVFGLGEKTGHHNRMGRDFTIWNTDVLDPYATREFTSGKRDGDPRAVRTSTEFDP